MRHYSVTPTRHVLKLPSGRTWVAESIDRPRGVCWEIINEAGDVQDAGYDRVLDMPDGSLVFEALGEQDLADAWNVLRRLTRATIIDRG